MHGFLQLMIGKMEDQKPKAAWSIEAFEEFLRKSKEESQRNQKILEEVRETQRRGRETQANVQNTLIGLRSTIESIAETTDKIKKFEQDYNDALEKLAAKVASQLEQQSQRPMFKAEVLPVSKIIQNVMKYQKFAFITGAGISAPSGIPTFRGKGGYWSSYLSGGELEAVYEAKKMLTTGFYDKYPKTVWKWHQEFSDLAKKCEPNEGHTLLDKICSLLVSKGKDVTLITQNLDNLQSTNPSYPIHHIHGDISYIRCEGRQMHLSPFTLDQEYCKECESRMRPHTLFFDEAYQHHYGGAVMGQKYDVVFSIGTMLETNMARRLVMQAEEVVEINPEPVLEYGKVSTLATPAAESLLLIYNELMK